MALFLLPIVVFWADFHLFKPISPFLEKYDPEFPYLMNSLEVFKGRAYYFADHPGTPVELLGTFFYFLIYPFLRLGHQQFILYNLQNPGLFLNIAHALLTLASMACAAFFLRLAKPTEGLASTLFAAALATSYFALHPLAFSLTSMWSHNSFAFPAGTLLLLLLLRELDRQRPAEIPTSTLVLLGLGAGIFASITAFFAAWMGGMLLALLITYGLARHSWKRAIGSATAFSAACVFGFGLMLLPLYERVPYFFRFVIGLLNHTNTYLGTPGTPLFTRMAANLADLFSVSPQLVLSSAVLLIVTVLTLALARKKVDAHPGLGGLICGLSAQILVLFLVILNDYSSNYFVSVAAVLPVLALALLKLYEWPERFSAWWKYAIVLLVAVGLVTALQAQMQSQQFWSNAIARRVDQEEASIAQYSQQLSKPRNQVITLWSYGTYSPCFSLWFGNAYTGYAFNQEINTLCPNFYFYDVWRGRVAHLSEASGDARVVVQPISAVNWDIFLGCRESFLQDVRKSGMQYHMITPRPITKIICADHKRGTFVIVMR